jgi:hypothetical protein
MPPSFAVEKATTGEKRRFRKEAAMRSKEKTKEASYEAVLASVKEEMAKPRMSESAQIETEKRSHARDRQPAEMRNSPYAMRRRRHGPQAGMGKA